MLAPVTSIAIDHSKTSSREHIVEHITITDGFHLVLLLALRAGSQGPRVWSHSSADFFRFLQRWNESAGSASSHFAPYSGFDKSGGSSVRSALVLPEIDIHRERKISKGHRCEERGRCDGARGIKMQGVRNFVDRLSVAAAQPV